MRVTAKKTVFPGNYLSLLASPWRALSAKLGEMLPNHFPIAIKLALLIIAVVVAGMGSLGAIMVNNQSQVMREQMHDFGRTVALQLAEISGELILSEDALGLSVLTTNLSGDNKVLGTAIYSYSGELLAAEGILPLDTAIQNVIADTAMERDQWAWSNPYNPSERLFSFMAPVRYQGVVAGYSLVTLSTGLMDGALRKTREYIIYATLLMSFVASVLAFWMGRKISRPIRDLMEATRAIDRGNYKVRIEDRRNDEIGFFDGRI